MLSKYLKPRFSRFCLRDFTKLQMQQYFSGMAGELSHPTILKIRDTLSSVLRAAVEVDYLTKNPLEQLRLPLDKRPRQPKPTITPAQFHSLIELVPEPYATMLFVSVWTGLRVSELIGLKWRCIHADSITIEERYCRGDWSTPKTNASAATIPVSQEVTARILRLKLLTVKIRAGRATRTYKLVKSDGPDDLVFQSVKDGRPMNDQNILKRHLQPAARKLGLPFVNWQCLRTSHATWLVASGADVKSVQSQMRHSRVSTSLEIYAQAIPTAQRRALEQLSVFAGVDTQESRSNSRSKTVQ
jgi:integrase